MKSFDQVFPFRKADCHLDSFQYLLKMKCKIIPALFYFYYIWHVNVSASNSKIVSAEDKEIIAKYGEIPLPEYYNKFKVPHARRCKRHPVVNVRVYLAITSIGNIDELKEVSFKQLFQLFIFIYILTDTLGKPNRKLNLKWILYLIGWIMSYLSLNIQIVFGIKQKLVPY